MVMSVSLYWLSVALNFMSRGYPLGSKATHEPTGWAVEASPLGEVEPVKTVPQWS